MSSNLPIFLVKLYRYDKNRFCGKFKDIAKKQNLTQAALAAMLGVDKRTISAWENNICEPSLTALARLCDIFDESFDGILT